MAHILHIIQLLSTGGAFRADIASIKYLKNLTPHSHSFLSLSQHLDDPEAKKIAADHGVPIVQWNSPEDLKRVLSEADIVHLNYWNCPEIDKFFESALPPIRLLGWFHIGGHTPPQYLPPSVIQNFDYAVACSPHTYDSPGFIEGRRDGIRTGMAYGAADFERLKKFSRKEHSSFNIGYIGTVNFLKMHKNFIPMSAAASIPNVKFIVCGSGGSEKELKEQSQKLGIQEKFDIRGYVSDINGVLSELDAYGYPLCKDTYAASEINLQEVMYAGIPPVVFPYGGISKLVNHQETGLIAHTEEEYSQYLEYLYLNPSERKRIGDNASKYAKEVFGAENAAKILQKYYEELLSIPKRERHSDLQPTPGHVAFLKYLDYEAVPFITTLNNQDEEALFTADDKIRNASELMKFGGITSFQRGYPNDPYLNLWAGLALESSDNAKALIHFVEALNNGLSHWRVLWYIAKTAHKAGELSLCKEALTALKAHAPHFKGAEELSKSIGL